MSLENLLGVFGKFFSNRHFSYDPVDKCPYNREKGFSTISLCCLGSNGQEWTTGASPIKLFKTVIYWYLQLARVFVPGKLF